MPSERICKTIHQYSKFPIPEENMKKLQELARDYNQVKNYVYDRYGGIGSLSKLYPGYTIQNEMTKSGLRAELGLPSVYFYLAMYDSLGDIRGQWVQTKSKISELVGWNENFSEADRHYLRFLLKVSNAFDSVLNQKTPELPKEILRQYERLAEETDTARLNRYLCRQVRKYAIRLHTNVKDGFSVSERAYRYGTCGNCHGIYLSTKENRRRVFIPLTDRNQYQCQLYIRLKPKEAGIEISVPIHVAVRQHRDYTEEIGLSMGIFTMLTTDAGHSYGEKLGEYQTEYAEWIRNQKSVYHRNYTANPGRKKYEAKKSRYEARLHGYINQELNRFLRTEKPQTVYIAKLYGGQSAGGSRKINNSFTLWHKGYIRERLKLKCREQSIELKEVFGKDISRECSECGRIGRKMNGIFFCDTCGYRDKEKTNTARNALKRGRSVRNVSGTLPVHKNRSSDEFRQ